MSTLRNLFRRFFLLTALLCGPVVVGSAAPASAAVDAWPLLELDEDTTVVLYPLYVEEEDFRMIFPIYYNTNDGQDHHVLWPIFKTSEGRVERVAPVFFRSHEDRFTLFPLIHQSENSTLWMIPPVYVSKRDDFHAVFPLYAHDAETTWVAPNLRFQRNPDGGLRQLTSFGLFDWEEHEEETELDLLLLSSFAWGGERTRATVFPIFDYDRSPDELRLWLAPFSRTKTPKIDSIALFPVFSRTRSDAGRSLWVGPWHRSHGPTHERQGVFGLYDVSRQEARNGNQIDRLSLLAWSYARSVERDADGDVVRRSRRFLIFTDRVTPESRSFGLLGLPIWESHRIEPRPAPVEEAPS